MDFSIPVMWGKKEEKDQQRVEKHKLNEGGKAAFERCKQKCECIRKPPTIYERLQVPKSQNAEKQITFIKRERERERDLFEQVICSSIILGYD